MESGQRAALKDRHKIRRPEMVEDNSRPASRLKYGEPAPLKLGRKIFLSHSGKDKNFVRILNKELCKYYEHDDKITFFDEESLPTAEPINMDNIIGEAKGSELGVLVLTEDFFVNTPNPMRELEALVACEVQLLPLFFTLSVDEVKDAIQSRKWEKQWRESLKVDEAVINVWRDAVKHVIKFSGLEYCKKATNWLDYINEIVTEVIQILPPAISFSEKGVAGMGRMCKVCIPTYIA